MTLSYTSKLLFRRMKEQGIRPTDAAKFLKIDRANVTNWKIKGSIPPNHIGKLSEFLCLPTSEVLRALQKDFGLKAEKCWKLVEETP